MNPFSIINQHNESEREKERIKRKQANRKKMDKQYLDEEKRWEKREEEKEKERHKNKLSEEDIYKRKKRLIEKDINFNSDEEERKNKENPKRLEEIKLIRLKEKEFDEMMRRKENPSLYQQEEVINKEVTDLVPIESLNNEIIEKEPEAKAVVTYQEYIDEDNENQIFEKPKLKLNIEKKTLITRENIIDEDEPSNDPYNINKTIPQLEIDEETEKVILEISNEVNLSRKEEEKRKLQQMHIKNVISSNGTSFETSKKIIELQKQIYESIPQNKDDLFKFPINWNLLIKVLII
jgi:hypothetical protein